MTATSGRSSAQLLRPGTRALVAHRGRAGEGVAGTTAPNAKVLKNRSPEFAGDPLIKLQNWVALERTLRPR